MLQNKAKNDMGMKSIIWKNKFSFFLNIFIILFITFGILYLFGLVPEEFKTTIGRYPDKEKVPEQKGELPLQIIIPIIGVNAQIYNPDSTSTEVLDSYLSKGAVRYPGSGLPGGSGNVFVFGHSTALKIVQNQAYKTFVGLNKLKPEDLIYVYSAGNEYTYKVRSVKMESADQALVVFNTKENLLTISTCNTFAKKEDRYVAEAQFVSKKPISTNNTQ